MLLAFCLEVMVLKALIGFGCSANQVQTIVHRVLKYQCRPTSAMANGRHHHSHSVLKQIFSFLFFWLKFANCNVCQDSRN